MGIIFKDVVGYADYQVSECGKVFRKKRTRYGMLKQGYTAINVKEIEMKVFTDKRGYSRVHLSNGKKHTLVLLHRIVALAHIENNNNLPQVNHKDGVKSNNHKDNLEWCTGIENMRHSWRIGLRVMEQGEKHPRSVLTEKEAAEILISGKSDIELGRIYGVSPTTAFNIKTGRTWKHLKSTLSMTTD